MNEAVEILQKMGFYKITPVMYAHQQTGVTVLIKPDTTPKELPHIIQQGVINKYLAEIHKLLRIKP